MQAAVRAKIQVQIWQIEKIVLSLPGWIEVWCNGSTTDFGSVCPGSNPGISTIKGGASHPLSLRYLSSYHPVALRQPSRARGMVSPNPLLSLRSLLMRKPPSFVEIMSYPRASHHPEGYWEKPCFSVRLRSGWEWRFATLVCWEKNALWMRNWYLISPDQATPNFVWVPLVPRAASPPKYGIKPHQKHFNFKLLLFCSLIEMDKLLVFAWFIDMNNVTSQN